MGNVMNNEGLDTNWQDLRSLTSWAAWKMAGDKDLLVHMQEKRRRRRVLSNRYMYYICKCQNIGKLNYGGGGLKCDAWALL